MDNMHILLFLLVSLLFLGGCIESEIKDDNEIKDKRYNVSDENVIVTLSKQKYRTGEKIRAEFIPKTAGLQLVTLIPYTGFHDPYVNIYHIQNNSPVKLDIGGYSGPWGEYCRFGKLEFGPVPSIRPYSASSFDEKIRFEWNQEYRIETKKPCEDRTLIEVVSRQVPSGKYKLKFSYTNEEFLKNKNTTAILSHDYYFGLKNVERSVEIDFEIE